jgi:hypothetical protein
MPTVSDITTTPLSGLNYIDALLDKGPDWNYFTPAPGAPANTLYYTFSVTSGLEDTQSTASIFTGSQQAFSAFQQAQTRLAFAYLSQVTGIKFVETSGGTDAQIHLANANLTGTTTTGLCSWHSSYGYSGNQLASYDADAYVYLDNVEWGAQNSNLAPGGYGYETLLHELGHALGLKHPFETTSDNSATLPVSQDSTANTLMSYNYVGSAYSQYQQDDLAALAWLYGGDGLGGALGINSTTGGRYLMGSSGNDNLVGTTADDVFQGNGGDDMINGGGGNDTAVFRAVRNDYNITVLSNGDLQVASKDGIDGTDTLHSVNTLQFADMSVTRQAILAANSGPDVPTLAVTKNANGYATGATPSVIGTADPGDTVHIYTSDNVLVGTATADSSTGLFNLVLSQFNDGTNYQIYATATNSTGVTSAASQSVSFNIDAHAPSVPTASAITGATGNQMIFSGSGEAGTTIELIRAGATTADFVEIAAAKVGADGKWSVTTSPLPNGDYTVAAVSVDLADNATSAAGKLGFSVNYAGNINGTANNDTLTPGAANIAIDGGAGTDTVVVNGPRANFTLAKEVWGFGLTDNVGGGGHDALLNVERVQFNDSWVALDVNGNAGEIFRLYQAAFDRPAEAAGLGYWIWRMDTGSSLTQVAHEFMTGQHEFDALYGTNPTDTDFINHLYENVLHREADAAGFAYWLNVLHTSPNARADVLIDFSESPENQALVIGTIQNGMTFTPWHQA